MRSLHHADKEFFLPSCTASLLGKVTVQRWTRQRAAAVFPSHAIWIQCSFWQSRLLDLCIMKAGITVLLLAWCFWHMPCTTGGILPKSGHYQQQQGLLCATHWAKVGAVCLCSSLLLNMCHKFHAREPSCSSRPKIWWSVFQWWVLICRAPRDFQWFCCLCHLL